MVYPQLFLSDSLQREDYQVQDRMENDRTTHSANVFGHSDTHIANDNDNDLDFDSANATTNTNINNTSNDSSVGSLNTGASSGNSSPTHIHPTACPGNWYPGDQNAAPHRELYEPIAIVGMGKSKYHCFSKVEIFV
jgi:hypothetical protein